MFDEKEISEQFESMVSGVPADSTSSSKSKKKTEPSLVEIEELPPKDITALPRGKLKQPRCPPGQRRNRKTRKCEPYQKKNGTKKAPVQEPEPTPEPEPESQTESQPKTEPEQKQETSFLGTLFSFGSTKPAP